MATHRIDVLASWRDRGVGAGLRILTGGLRGILSLQGLLIGFLGVRGLQGVVRGLGEMIEAGGKYITVQRAFNDQVGDGRAALARFRDAAGGTVRDYDLMRQANSAFLLGAAKSVDQFELMVQGSRRLGRALGIDAGFALESLTTGIGRQSVKWLDNLGIIVKAEQVYRDAADAMDKTVGQLTAGEKAAAFQAAAMAALAAKIQTLGEDVVTNADRLQVFRVRIDNIKASIGRLLNENTAIAGFFDAINDRLAGLLDAVEAGITPLPQIFLSVGKLAGIALAKGIADGLVPALQALFRTKLGTVLRFVPGVGADIGDRLQDAANEFGDTMEERLKIAGLEFDFIVAKARVELERAAEVGGIIGGGPGGGPALTRGLRPLAGPRTTQENARLVRHILEPVGPAFRSQVAIILGSIQELDAAGLLASEHLRIATQQLLDLGVSSERAAQLLGTAGDGWQNVATIAIDGASRVAEAWIMGTANIGQALSQLVTQVIQAQMRASTLGGLGIPLLGFAGGIVSGLFGRRSDPVRVSIADVEPSATRHFEQDITVQILDPMSHEVLREFEFRQAHRTRVDAIERLPTGARLGG